MGFAETTKACEGSNSGTGAKYTVELAVWKKKKINSAALFNCRLEHLESIRRSSVSNTVHLISLLLGKKA